MNDYLGEACDHSPLPSSQLDCHSLDEDQAFQGVSEWHFGLQLKNSSHTKPDQKIDFNFMFINVA